MSTAITAVDIARNRANFSEMEQRIMTLPQLNDDDFQLREYVSGGMYCREITIPKGSILTGRIYKFDHVEIMIRGDITILAADGGERRYQGHKVIEAKAGKRQAGFAHEETVWLTVNEVPSIPIEQMLDWTSVLTYAEFYAFHEQVDRNDYQKFLAETGLTQAQMDSIVMVDDVIDMPDFPYIVLKESGRHEMGIYSEVTLRRGELICPARIGQNRTIAGRFTNHSLCPNSAPVLNNGEFYHVALRDIPAGDEITVNYRDVLRLREMVGDKICLAM